MKRSLPFVVLALLAGCSSGSGSRGGIASTVAPATSGAPAAVGSSAGRPAPAPAVDDGTLPLVLIHGITGDPDDWIPLCDALEPGRTVVRELYVDEADALAKDSLPPDSVFALGYYRKNKAAPKYDPDPQGLSHGSIGGCPVARADGLDRSYYTTSYADRVRRGVEGIKRATGKRQVDLVLHSMGGLVGRAYVKWLANGSVRRIFLIASPGRGINALESSVLAVAKTGPMEFMRLGECLELSREGDAWGGKSFVEQLNDGWDAFCAKEGIRYAGMTLVGEHGAPSPSSSSNSSRTKAIMTFVNALSTFTPAQITQIPLLGRAIAHLPSEVTEALGDSDGTVRFESSRLDQDPFLASEFWGLYEGSHSNRGDPERGFASTYAAQCVRAFAIEGRTLRGARCQKAELTPIDVAGHATWLIADVRVDAPGCAAQLVEERLDAPGKAVSAIGYGAPLLPGEQRVPFVVAGGGGARRYRLVVYGEHGPIGARDGLVVNASPGAPTEEPLAKISSTTVRATASGPVVGLGFGSNARGGDPSLRYRVRCDGSAWGPEQAGDSFETPPLLAGHHRVEVVCRHSSNGAGIAVDGFRADAIGIVVDSAGAVSFVR